MANAMEIAPSKGMQALPPTRCVAPVVHSPCEGDGQNWPLASAGIVVPAVATPQPRRCWTRTSLLQQSNMVYIVLEHKQTDTYVPIHFRFPLNRVPHQVENAYHLMATTSGYASNNQFSGLTASDDEVSDNGTAETIVESINSHMANLSASVLIQSNASNNANTAIFYASMQQMAANKAQHNNEHERMIQQFAMMTTYQPGQQQFVNQNRLRVTAGDGVCSQSLYLHQHNIGRRRNNGPLREAEAAVATDPGLPGSSTNLITDLFQSLAKMGFKLMW